MRYFAVLFMLCGITNIFAQPNWEVVGQGGGGVIIDVVTHPTDPNIVWTVTDLTGIFRSKDGGVTYERMSGGIEKEEELFEWMRGMDHELVYDPSDPNIMYWAMDGGIYKEPGLYKSSDGGDSWFKIPGSPDLSPGAIAVDYNGIVYGVKHKNLYVSTDKGNSWEKKPDVPTVYCNNEYDWRRRYRIFIYATIDNKIIIGDRNEGTGIFITADQGNTWNNLLKGEEIMDFAGSPVTPGFFMALGQDGKLLRSVDGGKNFEVVESLKHSYYSLGTWPPFYGGIAINIYDDVMAIGRSEMGISTDEGLTFKKYEESQVSWDPGDYIFPNRKDNKRLFKCLKLAVSPASGKWYIVDGHLVKVSEDNGLSWIGRCKGIDILCVYTPPVIDKTNPDIIHVGAGDNGHYYSTDSGQSWKSSESIMRNVDGICQDPNNPLVYYKFYGRSRGNGSVLKSTDGGVTWEVISNLLLTGFKNRSEKNPSFYQGWIGKMVVDPTNSQRIYATHRAMDGLYMSEDGGYNFNRILELVRPWQLEVTERGNVFINTWDSEGLYRSTDNGASFQVISNKMVDDFVVHPNDDNIIYFNAGSFTHAWATANTFPNYERNREHIDKGKGCLYKTVDGGKAWEMLGAYDGFALYIEPNYPDVMLMSTRDGGQGIMRSMDAGKTWESIHGDHNNYHPRGFVYGGVPGRVYSWNHNLEVINNIHKVSFGTK